MSAVSCDAFLAFYCFCSGCANISFSEFVRIELSASTASSKIVLGDGGASQSEASAFTRGLIKTHMVL